MTERTESADAAAPVVCRSCESNLGVRRISPAPTVYEGRHWLIEHAYPVGLLGWMVIVLRRHAAALHELTPEEFRELGELQQVLIPALRELRNADREYVACFAEAEGFRHVHFHVVPVRADFPAGFRGARSLMLLTVPEPEAVPATDVREFCAALQRRLAGGDVSLRPE